MKQNEKILVYAVTGFLVVILMIAIVFGRDARPESNEVAQDGSVTGAPRSFEDMLNDRTGPEGAGTGGDQSGREGSGTGEATDPSAEEVGVDADGQPLGGSPGGSGAGEVGDGAIDLMGAVDPLTNRPLAVNVPLQPPTAAALVTEKLGLNRREHDFRIVRARPGDSLGSLVQKWCGSTADYVDMAKGLNEELSVLRVGQEVVLPWVDDEEVLAAFEARGAQPTRPVEASASGAAGNPENAQPAVAANAPVNSRKYKIQPGESLWKVAEREVGLRGAPKFLEKVRALNPGLDVDRLKVGQIIVLPPKS